MCLAVPMKVLEVNEDRGVVEMWGVRRTAEFSLLDEVRVGDYVLIHAGFALQVIDPVEAEKTLELFREVLEQTDQIEGERITDENHRSLS